MKKMNYLIGSLFGIGALCFGVKIFLEMFDATKSGMTSDGFLQEPFFFLIPLGYLFIIAGILVLVTKFIMKFTRRPQV